MNGMEPNKPQNDWQEIEMIILQTKNGAERQRHAIRDDGKPRFIHTGTGDRASYSWAFYREGWILKPELVRLMNVVPRSMGMEYPKEVRFAKRVFLAVLIRYP